MNSRDTRIFPKLGEIYCMMFDGVMSEQNGWRPGLVIQNNTGNKYSPNIIAVPLTSKLKKVTQPTHVLLPETIGLKRDSVVLCENPQRVSKEKIGSYITTVPETYMEQVAEAYILATSVISFIDVKSLMVLWEKANQLNSR